jgi:hypothetical protein
MDNNGQQSFSDIVAKFRARLLDAKRLDVGSDEPQENALGMLMQVLSEVEKQRQECIRQMYSHREQAKASEFQASALASVHSMAWAVYDGFIKAEEKSIEERAEAEGKKKKK